MFMKDSEVKKGLDKELVKFVKIETDLENTFFLHY
jgi:hypothetical protein